MGFFKKQMANVIEWEENAEGVIFHKWKDNQIKKGSTLIIRPGQDAVFMIDGRIEGIFEDEGRYDVESQIIPFLSSLKGAKYGFNSGIRAEIIFVNTKALRVKWGTKGPIAIADEKNPEGLLVRAFGTFECKVSDYVTVIDTIAGVQDEYTVEELRDKISAELDQLLMKWIGKEGVNIYNLQQNAEAIASGIKEELDMKMFKFGITITNFNISNFSYPQR